MKYATAAVAVLPLAWAATIDTRGQDSKYNVSELEAACDSNDKCSYNFKIATGDDGESTDCSMKSLMKMGAAPETKCGPYSVSAMKPHDGGLIFNIDQAGKGLSGTFTAYPKDLKTVKSDDGERMSYKGGAAFDVAAKAVNIKADDEKDGDDDKEGSTTAAPKVSSIASHAAMDPPQATSSAKPSMIFSVGDGSGPVAGTTKVESADPTAVPTGSLKLAPSAAPSAASGGSTMVTATATDSSSSSKSTSASDDSSSSSSSSSSSDKSDSSSSSDDESSGAARQSAFAAVMAAVGLMAFAF
ncbi:hypothetical protein PG985_014770 [Apiospora marii]|uniref:Uncharacterized protein n=1 Tax=Apiospora marii TaxID=335849 RepID=A0ABR1R4U0_9PEZI